MKTYRLTVRLKGERFPACLPDGIIGYQDVSFNNTELTHPMLAVSLLNIEKSLIEQLITCDLSEIDEVGMKPSSY